MTKRNSLAGETGKRVMLDLPAKKSSLLSQIDNINYALEQLQAYEGDNPVVGYFRIRSLGTREILHQILPQEIAESVRESDSNFSYVTLDRLLERKEGLASGK